MISNLDDVWTIAPGITDRDEVVRDRRHRYRIRMVMAVGVSYLIDCFLLFLFSAAGTVQVQVPVVYGLLGIGHVLIFSLLHWTGVSDHTKSSQLTEWQMVYAIAVHLFFVAWVPPIATYFLSIIFVIFGFSALRLSLRSAVIMWALAIVATGTVLLVFRSERVGLANPSMFESVTILASFAMVLLRCILLGYYASQLRLRMFKKNRNLAEEIAERKCMEAELERHHLHLEELVAERTRALSIAKEAAETANRAKNTFLATMSHELLTPLSGIMGITELMKRHATDAGTQSQLLKMGDAQNRLLHVINGILQHSKLEAGRLTLECNAFSLNSILMRVSSQLHPLADEKEISLSVANLANWDGVEFFGDSARIGQIVSEFAANAIKFTERGGSVKVACEIAEVPGDAVLCRFSVSDNGIGISPDKLDRVFNSFEQVDGSFSRAYGGLGLGLAICKQLAELMGGKVGAVSKPGVGSTFWFTVRLLKDSSTAAARSSVHPLA